MIAAGMTHIGNIRNNNEDAYFIHPQNTLIAVADGMGGHKAGEIASGIAIEAIASLAELDQDSEFQPAEVFCKAFSEANRRIWERAHENEACKGMGTTLTSAWIFDSLAYVAHVGDSRAYHLNHGRIRQVTRDHTLVEELIKNGSIDRESAMRHPQKNVLMKAVGADDSVVPDILEIEIHEGDVLLLCSDGLTHYLDESEICLSLTHTSSLEDSLAEMTELALERGGSDNITVVAVRIEENGGGQ
jgi:protein phosphatase